MNKKRILLALPLMIWGFNSCGQEADIPEIESTIQSGISEQTGIDTDVECPSSIDWEANDTFNCIASYVSASEVTVSENVVVTMENDEGDITWRTGN